MVSDAQKEIIKNTWAGIDLGNTGKTFYASMKNKADKSYAVFKFGDDDPMTSDRVAQQGMKVMKFVDKAVNKIDDLGAVEADIAPLAQRHINYKAEKHHFPPVAPCMLEAIEKNCGGKWSPEAAAAWTAFYQFICDHLTVHLT